MIKWLQFSYLINIVMSCFYSLRCKTYTLYALQIFPNKCCRQSGSLQWWLVAMTHSSMSWVWRRGRRWWWSWWWWWWSMAMKAIHSSIEKRWWANDEGPIEKAATLRSQKPWQSKCVISDLQVAKMIEGEGKFDTCVLEASCQFIIYHFQRLIIYNLYWCKLDTCVLDMAAANLQSILKHLEQNNS